MPRPSSMTRPDTKIAPAASTCRPRWHGRPTASPCIKVKVCGRGARWRRTSRPDWRTPSRFPDLRRPRHASGKRIDTGFCRAGRWPTDTPSSACRRSAARRCRDERALRRQVPRGGRRRAGERDDQLLAPGVDPQGLRTEVGFHESEHRGDVRAGSGHFTCSWRFRLQGPAVTGCSNRDEPSDHLERDSIPRVGELAHHVRTAQRRMTGERHFERRREYPHMRGRVRRRQDERRLGQVELQCDRLHRRIVEPSSVFDDRERVATEAFFGEDIDDTKSEVAHSDVLQDVANDSRHSTIDRTSCASASKFAGPTSITVMSSACAPDAKFSLIDRL